MLLTGHRVIVTGATSGIGLAAVQTFAARGARVALMARSVEPLTALASTYAQQAFPADVRNDKAVGRAFDGAVEWLGGLDLVINSAGVVLPGPFDGPLDDWNAQIGANLTGAWHVARHAARIMRARRSGGTLIFLSSDAAVKGIPGYAAYCASKAGVEGLTRALAVELAPKIRVNAIAPGPVDTPMLAAEFADADDPSAARAAMLARVPLQRFCSAEDIAYALCYLATAPTTGNVLRLDGGTTA